MVTALAIKQCAHLLIPPQINDHLLQSIFDFTHARNHEKVAYNLVSDGTFNDSVNE
jgi:hypothetical protein